MVLGLTGASYDGQATINAQPTESTSVFHNAVQKKYYYNATQKKDVTAAWGAEVSITWTDPDLKWGTFSAHRVALVQQSPWRYAEVGWIKRTTGLFIFVTWDDGSGPQSRQFSNLSPATHVYSSQYDPNTIGHKLRSCGHCQGGSGSCVFSDPFDNPQPLGIGGQVSNEVCGFAPA